MNIAINELFFSIQGEGPNCGAPAVFIRFQGCQLRCPWCDTGGSLDPNDPHEDMTPEQVLTHISQWPCRHAVITGGDPSFQPDGLDALTTLLSQNGFTLEIETSGLRPVDKEICTRFSYINVGLKLPNAEQKFADNYYRNAAEHYGAMGNANFKIVIAGPDDVEFVQTRLVESGLIPRDRIYLMPLGDTIDQQNANAPTVLETCKQYGFHFSPRLHIMFGVR